MQTQCFLQEATASDLVLVLQGAAQIVQGAGEIRRNRRPAYGKFGLFVTALLEQRQPQLLGPRRIADRSVRGVR